MYRDTDLRVLIVGGGRVGRKTSELLLEYGHEPVLVDRDADVASKLRDAATQYTDVVHGDATEAETLREAGVEESDVVLALTHTTETNIEICEAARELAPSIRTIARLDRESTDDDESEGVDEFVYPEYAGARVAVDLALGDPVRPIADLDTTIEVVSLEATADAPAAGKPLEDVLVPSDATVIADLDGEELADGETVVTPGSRYLIATKPAVADDLKKLFRG